MAAPRNDEEMERIAKMHGGHSLFLDHRDVQAATSLSSRLERRTRV